jgi:hypothetical protein
MEAPAVAPVTAVTVGVEAVAKLRAQVCPEPAPQAELRPKALTVAVRAPAEQAEVSTTIVLTVAEITRATHPPKFTATADVDGLNAKPVMVAVVPPRVDPELGETLITWGVYRTVVEVDGRLNAPTSATRTSTA